MHAYHTGVKTCVQIVSKNGLRKYKKFNLFVVDLDFLNVRHVDIKSELVPHDAMVMREVIRHGHVIYCLHSNCILLLA